MSVRTDARPGIFLVTMSCLVLGACSSGESSSSEASGSSGGRPVVELIDEAISAVDEHFSATSEFYEINATSDGVNLFVSTTIDGGLPGVVQARYTASDGLVVADDALPSDGAVFRGDAVDFDPDTIIDGAIEQLSTAQPRVFVITAGSVAGNSGVEPDRSRVTYRLVMESQRGGRLVVFLGRDGTILGSDVLD